MSNSARSLVISILALIVALIGLFYIVASALASQPGVLAIVLFFMFTPVTLWALSGEIYRHRSVRRDQAIDAAPQVVTPPLSLPEPKWISPSANMLTRTSVLDDKARRIAQELRNAGLQPTRINIKLYGADMGLAGNEAASVIYQRWVRWDWCEPVAQGQAGKWKEEVDE